MADLVGLSTLTALFIPLHASPIERRRVAQTRLPKRLSSCRYRVCYCEMLHKSAWLRSPDVPREAVDLRAMADEPNRVGYGSRLMKHNHECRLFGNLSLTTVSSRTYVPCFSPAQRGPTHRVDKLPVLIFSKVARSECPLFRKVRAT